MVLSLHQQLDEAVAAAYGWPAHLPEAELLQRLVQLNHARAAKEAAGLVRYLRPAYQAPELQQQALVLPGRAAKTASPAATGPRIGSNGDLHVAGRFSSTASFGSFALTTALPLETYVARLGNTVLSTTSARPLALALTPNPATSRVRLSGLPAGRPLKILDGLGRAVRTATLAPDASFSVQGLAPGLYLVRALNAQNQAYAGRLVVE